MTMSINEPHRFSSGPLTSRNYKFRYLSPVNSRDSRTQPSPETGYVVPASKLLQTGTTLDPTRRRRLWWSGKTPTNQGQSPEPTPEVLLGVVQGETEYVFLLGLPGRQKEVSGQRVRVPVPRTPSLTPPPLCPHLLRFFDLFVSGQRSQCPDL